MYMCIHVHAHVSIDEVMVLFTCMNFLMHKRCDLCRHSWAELAYHDSRVKISVPVHLG